MGFVETVNPATGEKMARYELLSARQALDVAGKVHDSYRRWGRLPLDERCDLIKSLAKALRSKKSRYAKTMTLEMGKPISQSEAEVEKCAWTADVYSENSRAWLADESGKTDANSSYVTFEPLGVILSIMPWNFPFWQAFRFAIPAMAAGNVSVLRHSNACPGSALAIEESFIEAEFPQNAFRTVITDHRVVSELIKSDQVRGVSLTGSVEVGTMVGQQAAASLKKCVLELGGSDPFVVLEDADATRAADVGVEARLINSGQSCIAAKRFIVVEAISREFIERFTRQMERKRTGDPMDPRTDVGPLVNAEQVAKVEAQVRDAVSKGARVSLGGRPREGAGAYYEPTVLERVAPAMKVMREEVFGPVAPLYVVKDEKAAVAAANRSQFGLGASIWTSSSVRAKNVVKAIESGVVFVNALVKSDPRMPFGGVKMSGIGRELSRYGLREFVNVKSVNIYSIHGPAASGRARAKTASVE